MMIDGSDRIQSETSRTPFESALYWTLGGWFVLICGLLVVCLLHYSSETLQNSPQLWFASHILLGLAVAPILWLGTSCVRNIGLRLGAFVLQCLAGFFVYVVFCVYYTALAGFPIR